MIALLATVALHSSLPTFTNWCALNGVIGLAPNGAISPATTPSSGLGLFAARTIKPGETLLRVPLRLALADRLLVGLDGASPKPPFKDAPWQASLAQRLSEAEDLSAPWLDILPSGVQGLSDESVADELQYAPAATALATLRTERSELAERLATSPDDCERFERYISLAHTRAFLLELIPGDPWASCHALVPLMDLFNHAADADSHVEWALEGGGASVDSLAMVVSAKWEVGQGEQLTLCYEPTATNDDFCVYHGFVPSSNECDDVELFDSVDEAIAWHRQVFAELMNEPSEEIAMAAAGLAALPPLDGSAHMRRVGVASAGPSGKPLWIRSEEVDPRLLATFRLLVAEFSTPPEDAGAHAARAIRKRCEEVLAAFPTTLAQDLELLNTISDGESTIGASDVNAAVARAAEGCCQPQKPRA